MADVKPGTLTILRFDTPNGSPQQVGDPFEVDFNPSTFSISNTITYDTVNTQGNDGGDPVFHGIPPVNFNITFTIDGTGAAKDIPVSQQKEHVRNRIVDLRKTAIIDSNLHRPQYLAVLWGKIYIECVLTSLNITFTLFDADGSPLRAKVICNFLQRKPNGEAARDTSYQSADLTKLKSTIEGDTLPLIAKKHYESSSYYLQLAKANKLKNFRKLKPGTKLVLPPMKNK